MPDAALQAAGWSSPKFVFGSSGLDEVARLCCPYCGSKELHAGPVTVHFEDKVAVIKRARMEVYEADVPSGTAVQLSYSCGQGHRFLYNLISMETPRGSGVAISMQLERSNPQPSENAGG